MVQVYAPHIIKTLYRNVLVVSEVLIVFLRNKIQRPLVS